MIELTELSEQIRKDAARAKDLTEALRFCDSAEADAIASGAKVETFIPLGRVFSGNSKACAEIDDYYTRLLPQAIVSVREICKAELERITARYAPLLQEPAE